jgi:hypothetical protein
MGACHQYPQWILPLSVSRNQRPLGRAAAGRLTCRKPGKIVVKVINHCADYVLKLYDVREARR